MGFTLLLWAFMILIYFSAKKNKANRWCAITIFIFSFGTFKEFLYFDVAPTIMTRFPNLLSQSTIDSIYSIMTAILYYLVMPCCVIFAIHFSSIEYRNYRFYQIIRYTAFLPAIVLAFLYSPTKISYYQHTSKPFWYVVTVYNLLLAMIMAFLMIQSIICVKSPLLKRQKKLISMVILPPVWYWLITIFVIHSLGITSLYKVWKENAILLTVSVLVYIFAAFTEGIMGLKLQSQNFQWDSDMKIASKGAQYTSHLLKNEITKIEWCIDNLSNSYSSDKPEELAIIERSACHLKEFVHKTKLYSDDIILKKELITIKDLINLAILSTKSQVGDGVLFSCNYTENDVVLCDQEHMCEVLNNLILNAADAMNKQGNITISSIRQKNMQVISVADEGEGIPKKYISQIYNPYFTTKRTSSHFGLGLSYCYNVIKKHKGYIDIKTEALKGSTFYLYLPVN